MKTLLFTLTFSIGVLMTNLSFGQANFGLRFGGQLTNLPENYDSEFEDLESDLENRPSFHLGFEWDNPVSENFRMRYGLLYSKKGTQMVDKSDGIKSKAALDIHYLEVPINFVYYSEGLMLSAGPYLGVAMGGQFKATVEGEFNGQSIDDERTVKVKSTFGSVSMEDTDSEDLYINALDFGLNFGIGYQFDNVSLNLGYGLGLVNLTPDVEGSGGEFDPSDFRQTNSVISLSLTIFTSKMR